MKKGGKIPGSALFYALLLAVIVAVLSTALITASYYYQSLHQQQAVQLRLIHNLESATALLLNGAWKIGETIEGGLYGQPADSFQLKIHPWGIYPAATAKVFKTTAFGKQERARAALLGRRQSEVGGSALYLQDNYKPLALCGHTRIRGEAFIPSSGILKGRISGHAYSGGQMVYGREKPSRPTMPPLDTTALLATLNRWEAAARAPYHQGALPDSLWQPFLDTTITIRRRTIHLQRQQLAGNIILLADSLVRVEAGARLEDIVLYAPEIIIEAGFSGSLQAIASRSIQVQESAQLEYPSSLALLDGPARQPGATPRLHLAAGAQLAGMLLAANIGAKPTEAPEAILAPGSTVEGMVYANGSLELQGTVKGHVSCRNFHLKIKGRGYYNHLLDAVIDAAALEEYFSNAPIMQTREKWVASKWLK